MNALDVTAAFIAVGILILVTLHCFCLRDFSRGRLEELCVKRGEPERFSKILQNHDRYLLLSEVVLLVLLVSAAIAANELFFLHGAKLLQTGAQLNESSTNAWSILLTVANVAAVLVAASFFLVALPWTLARVIGELWLYHTLPLFNGIYWLLSPIWFLVFRLDRIIHRIFELPEPDSEAATHMLTEELLSVVHESQREGIIQSTASNMIHRVIDLQNEDVASIMTPRTDMVTIEADVPLADAMNVVLESGFSRMPVIREGIDDIVGILYARDLLSHATASVASDDQGANAAAGSAAEQCAADIAREVLYAPESQGIGDLLDSMRVKKVHMAIIVDEYSGVSGVVTMEDILEEIVGDISDEYDKQDDTLWIKHTDGITEVDARYHLDDLNEAYSYGFPEDEEFDTIAGFALSCFGRIPAVGDEQTWNNLKLVILEADQRSVLKVRIEGYGDSRESRRAASE